MSEINKNPITVLERVKGDLDPIPFQLQDNDGVAIDITGKTLHMRLIAMSNGAVKLAAGVCTISDAATGKGYYQPVAVDVDTVGDYAVYVLDVVAGAETADPRYPFDGPNYLLKVINENGTQS